MSRNKNRNHHNKKQKQQVIKPIVTHQIIDLSDAVLHDDDDVDRRHHEEEDELLDELLGDDDHEHDGDDGDSYDYDAGHHQKTSVGTSRTVETDELSPPLSPLSPGSACRGGGGAAGGFREREGYYDDIVSGDDDEDGEEEEEEDDRSVSSMESVDAATLLEMAHDRLHFQDLQDEVRQLKEVIARKDRELENLTGQLRRAVATKCDLVLAHNELEMHHEQNLRRRDDGLMQLKKANLGLVEAQSEVEKDLLNEIVTLTERIKAMERRRQQDMDEWDDMHKNEIAQKEFKIAKLQEELRKLKYPNRHHGRNASTGGGGGGGGVIGLFKRV